MFPDKIRGIGEGLSLRVRGDAEKACRRGVRSPSHQSEPRETYPQRCFMFNWGGLFTSSPFRLTSLTNTQVSAA